ncbi:hypothetical protein [Metabacillus fastidiosus]|uniref:hypothetical protein n=1 Tax=Metabacillus fastidiosus TaxID=1458 RepID=UPI002DBFB5C0|nr:hypothetical protein [Metabacillus fastidiosus]MEC2076108.1 hypothetical protein [Metabacillus fastidiosus]
MHINRETLQELIRKTGETARKEAQKHGTYIVYRDVNGNTIREYANGKVVVEGKFRDKYK